MALRLPFVIAALGAALLCASAFGSSARAQDQEPLAQIAGLPEGPVADTVRLAIGTADAPPATLFEARRRAEQARDRAVAALRSEGYYAARVQPRIDPGEALAPTLEIASGPRFVIGTVQVEVAGQTETALAESALVAAALTPGAPARAADVIAAETRAIIAVETAGHPDVRALDRQVTVDHARGEMDVVLRVESGRAMVFGPVRVEGDARLRAEYLMRLAPFEPGDRYDREDLDTLATRLRETGAFESVAVRLAESEGPGVAPETRAVIADISEGPRRSISLGARYTSSEGESVEGAWTRRNVFGGAESLSVYAEIGTLQSRLGVELAAPHWRKPGRTLRVNLTASAEETDAYERQALEAGARIETRLTERLSGSLGTGVTLSDVDDGTDTEKFALVYVSGAASWDDTDDPIDPKRGVRASASARPTVGYGDDPVAYVVAQTAASAYRPLGDKVVAAIRGRLGGIIGPALTEVPANERFFAGGGGSIRGYDYQAVSPRNAEGIPVGGRSLVEASAEVRYRGEGRFGYAAFIDGGAASDGLAPEIDEIRWGAGFGVLYYTRIGPIRADIAFPLDRREGEPEVQFYINLGQAF